MTEGNGAAIPAVGPEEGKDLPPVVSIENISRFEGQEVTVQGWLYNLRQSGKLLFPIFRDGTGLLQGIVAKKAVSPEVFALTRELTQESSLIVRGTVRADSRAVGGYEMDVTQLELVQGVPVEEPFPITPKEHGVEFLMHHRHLWLRSQRQNAILRIRHEISKACRDYLDGEGFILVDTPILTPAACEGTTTLFETQYFDDKAFLTQSGQLYSEATAAAFGKVYCFGPTFRAEKSKTRRHLTEFWMVEPEMAFATLEDAMKLAERFVTFVVQRVLANRKRELETLGRDVSRLEQVEVPFPRISYDEAVEILRRKGSDFEWGGDFGGTDETLLSEEFPKPVMVHRFPAAIKAFYMEPDASRPEVVLGVDVLAPEGYGEIIGGGQRIADRNLLHRRIQEQNLPEASFDWYEDLRKYGSVPHAGFGMGIERVVAWICGLEHVRETIAFPRMLHRMRP
ncbi:MAG: asparagine--tRNA ligase [Acidobacteria bacterium]|nr:asparagine--tRNA ligase [Acidobacteriota bacterium]